MAGLFPFIGFNLAFWVLVGLVRFVSEHAFGTLGIARAAHSVKTFADRNFQVLQDPYGFAGAMMGAMLGFGGFVFFFNVAGILQSVSDAASAASVYSSLGAWFVFALIAGYAASRIEVEHPLASACAAGILYWFFRVAAIIASSGVPYLNIGFAFAALGFLLALALLASLLGGIAGGHFNREDRRREARLAATKVERIRPEEVASITPAHNEEKTIAKTIESLKRILPAGNIYIGSDASTDRTVEIARSLGAVVADIKPNRGKANVLAYLIEENKLCDRYKAVIIVDADSEVEPDYLENALPLFDDPDTSAVAVHAMSKWDDTNPLGIAGLIRSYRVRFYRVLQATLKYGQTWKYTNATPIVPGFASIYRTTALRHIAVNAPGMVIEDFNMTFELYHKKLGRVAYSPGVHAASRDPLTFKDYYKQVKRWNLGLWQTIRRHGFWPSLFSVTLFSFLIEMILTSLFTLALPFIILALFLVPGDAIHAPLLWGQSLFTLSLFGVAVFVILDYLMTALVALYERKPILLVDGFAFMFLRYIDAYTFLFTLPLAFTTRSDGKWVSPKR